MRQGSKGLGFRRLKASGFKAGSVAKDSGQIFLGLRRQVLQLTDRKFHSYAQTTTSEADDQKKTVRKPLLAESDEA